MKIRKGLSYLILVPFLSSLVSCSGDYKLEVIFDGSIADSVIRSPKSGYYNADDELLIRANILYDAQIYVFLNNELETTTSWANDFNERKIEMPSKDSTLVLTMDRFYATDVTTISKIIPSYMEKGEITKIRIRDGYNGVRPGSLDIVKYTDSQDDIDRFYSFFDEKVQKCDNDLVPDGGNYRIISFIGSDYENSYRISNKIISSTDFTSSTNFKILSESFYSDYDISSPTLSRYMFGNLPPVSSTSTYYKYDEETEDYVETSKTFRELGEIEFINAEKIETPPLGYLETRLLEDIFIYSDKIFSFENNFYGVAGDIDFTTLTI